MVYLLHIHCAYPDEIQSRTRLWVQDGLQKLAILANEWHFEIGNNDFHSCLYHV